MIGEINTSQKSLHTNRCQDHKRIKDTADTRAKSQTESSFFSRRGQAALGGLAAIARVTNAKVGEQSDWSSVYIHAFLMEDLYLKWPGGVREPSSLFRYAFFMPEDRR